jgi:hypothetical protein
MNSRQICLRLRNLLRARLWRGYVGDAGVGSKVWADGSVRITMVPTEAGFRATPPPCAYIAPGSARPDEEAAGSLEESVVVTLGAAVSGDQVGEAALVGASRAGKDTSAGRGLLELQTELLAVARILTEQDGVHLQLKGASFVRPDFIESVGYLVWRDYEFEAQLTDVITYPHVASLTGSEAGGTVTLTWTAPDDTTDLVEYVVRRVAGSVPTPFPSGGTDIALGSPLDLTVNNAPGSGTFTYSVFAGYDEEGGATAIHHSDFRSVTVVVP